MADKSSISTETITQLEQAANRYNDRRFRNPNRETGYQFVHDLIDHGTAQKGNRISVIVPVYGNVSVGRLETSLLSLKRQRGVPVEIVLAEQTFDNEKYRGIAEKHGVLYVSDRLEESLAGKHFNSGRIRNVAIHKSSGQFIYTSDSDILFQNPDYMAKIVRALQVSPDLVLKFPRMKHLVKDNQEGFYARFSNSPGWADIATDIVSHGEWLYSYKGQPHLGFHNIEYCGMPMIILDEDYETYMHTPDASTGWQERWFLALRHNGAIAARRSQIDAAGGYAECFYQWGYEDYDLQWKLGELYCVVPLENNAEFEVIHLDHDKGWFDKLLFERNSLLHLRRRQMTVGGAIIDDVLGNKSSYGVALKKRWRIDLSGGIR